MPDRASVASRPQPVGIFLMSNTFETGGSERQFAALAQSLDGDQFSLHLGCLAKRGDFSEGLGEVTEFPIGPNLYGLQSLRARLRLAAFLRNLRISVAHAFDFYTNLMLIPAARMAGVPVLIGSQRQLGDLLPHSKSRAQATMLRWCDCVVSNSRAAAERLISQGVPERRIVIIRNGLPPACFALTSPAFPRRPGIVRVGMIARMNTASKNHRIFLRAAARLRGKFPELEFVLAGDGPLRPAFEREAADLGITNCVHFLGDRRDIPAVLASIDISVLPTASESLSNVVIESMAAGVPVVASRVGGNPELIDEMRGILVAPGDEQSLADGIERLLRDRSMGAELARNAKIFAEQNFTIAEMRQRHEDLYAELLARKARRRKTQHFFQRNGRSPLRLRVAIVAASLRYVGGQSVQADSLVSNLRDDPAIEAHLIPIDPAFPSLLKWAEKVPLLRTLLREPIYLWALWRGLKDSDIAHIFSASYWSFLLAPAPAWLIARLAGKKTLIHYHSGEARDHLSRFRSARPILARADLLVVPSGYLRDVFREFGLDAKVVPNIIDLSQFSFRLRRPFRPRLVCTRGFHPYYCVDVVVKAFAEVQRCYPEATLDLVGGGPAEAEIRKLVDDLELSNVEFSGVISRQEIGRHYDRADIFINASRLDNMPVSVLEAFLSGTPVITTSPEGMDYIVDQGRTGLLSPPGDAEALARNVLRVLEDQELANQLAYNAHQESQRYCWTAVREQWLRLYGSLLFSSGNVS